MRKKAYMLLVFTVIPLLLIACSSKKRERMDKILKKALADGKSAKITTSYNNSDQITTYWLTIYNDGKEEKGYVFNKKKRLASYTTFEYDKCGNITKELEYSPSSGLHNTRYNKYDEQDRLAEYFDQHVGTQEYTYIVRCEYDISNNLIKTVEYQDEITNANLYGYSDYEYEDNQLMAVKIYGYDFENKKGFLKWYYVNEYDDEGRVNKIFFYNNQGELTSYNIIEYR